MASSVENVITKSIRRELNYIVENIEPELYYTDLFSDNILSWEECENIEQDRKNFGKTRQARTLVTKMLQKPESQVAVFLDMIRGRENHVWERIDATRQGVESGDMQLHHQIDVKALAESLMATYKKKAEWRHLEPIPGEKITLDVGDDQDLFMQPVFTTQIIDSGKQDMFRFSGTNDPKYTDIKCENLEGIFELSKNLSKDEKMSRMNKVHSNLHTVAGVAGVGKTTAMHRMVWDWASKMGKIHDNYDLVFFIPVRKTEKEQKILDVLANLGFLSHQEKEAFQEHMNNRQCAGKVLFIFDGADESELPQDIGQIILGELYPGSTVVVTMRPEAETIKTLGVIKPVISVSMQGTNEKSVHTFIHKMLHDKEKSKVEALYQKCKESMYDFKLLCIPLYLMLICLVFREESFNMSTFSVPSTMTELFNMIFHVIINRWVERTLGKSVTFKKSPLEADSNIPVQIKRILLSIANMCYNALCDNKYEFYQNDLNQFCLSSEDIVKSGLFHVSGSGDNLLIYLKHKQLQEYLAAMFLTYQGHKTPPFSNIFTQSENKQSLAQVVGAENLIKTVQFCCGMSQKFCQYIFTTAIKCCVIEKTESGSVDVYYEASLVQESQSHELLFQNYLLQCDIKTEKQVFNKKYFSSKTVVPTIGSFDSYRKNISKLIQALDSKTAISHLNKLYDLHVSKIQQTSNLFTITNYNSKTNTELKLNLDQLSFELLSKFTFPQVETVQVRTHDTAYMDMCVITDIFPAVRSVDIAGQYTVSYKCVRGADTYTQVPHSKLTHMSIHSNNNDLYLPDEDLELILHQPNLSSLYMHRVYILDSIGCGDVKCSLSALCELVLILGTLHTEPSSVTGLCTLLQSCPQLHTLRLMVEFSDDVDVTPVITQISHMTHLTHMFIGIGPARHIPAMLHSVSDSPRLTHLSTPVSCIKGVEEEVTRALCRSRSLRSLTVWDFRDSEGKPTGYTFPPHCVHTLRQHRVTVSVKTRDRPKSLDELIIMYKKL